MCLLTDFLLNTDTSVYEYFDGHIYNQAVRTKNKQTDLEIINSKDFFEKLHNPQIDAAITSYLNEAIIEELTSYLCLDQNFKELLLVKKVIKMLEELSHNEELRDRAGMTLDIEDTIPNEDEDVFVIHPEEMESDKIIEEAESQYSEA